MHKINIKPVETNNSEYEQLEKIKEEYNEYYNAVMEDTNKEEELCDLMQTCITQLARYGDIKEIWEKHNKKMESRNWKERE